MVFFAKSEEKLRHANIDKALGATREVLTDPAVSDTLGFIATSFLDILDTLLYVPNERHGVLLKPRKVKHEDAIAATALSTSELLKVGPGVVAPLPRQAELFHKWYRSTQLNPKEDDRQRSSELIKGFTQKAEEQFEVTTAERTGASVMRPVARFSIRSTKYDERMNMMFAGRPFLAFNYSMIDAPTVGTGGVHELQHIQQVLSGRQADTIYKDDEKTMKERRLRGELEAYHLQHIAEFALYSASPNGKFFNNVTIVDDVAFKVEATRQEVNADLKDAFTPSSQINAILTDANYKIM